MEIINGLLRDLYTGYYGCFIGTYILVNEEVPMYLFKTSDNKMWVNIKLEKTVLDIIDKTVIEHKANYTVVDWNIGSLGWYEY